MVRAGKELFNPGPPQDTQPRGSSWTSSLAEDRVCSLPSYQRRGADHAAERQDGAGLVKLLESSHIATKRLSEPKQELRLLDVLEMTQLSLPPPRMRYQPSVRAAEPLVHLCPLTVTVDLSKQSFIRSLFPPSINSTHCQDIHIAIFFNGVLASSRVIPFRILCGRDPQVDELTQSFTGRRVGRATEWKWVLVPLQQNADGSTRNLSRSARASMGPVQRWNEIAESLGNEAHQWGVNEHGDPSVMSDYLTSLSRLEVPSEVSTMQRNGGQKFGTVDVIITTGQSKKDVNGRYYLYEPTRTLDPRFNHRLTTATFPTKPDSTTPDTPTPMPLESRSIGQRTVKLTLKPPRKTSGRHPSAIFPPPPPLRSPHSGRPASSAARPSRAKPGPKPRTSSTPQHRENGVASFPMVLIQGSERSNPTSSPPSSSTGQDAPSSATTLPNPAMQTMPTPDISPQSRTPPKASVPGSLIPFKRRHASSLSNKPRKRAQIQDPSTLLPATSAMPAMPATPTSRPAASTGGSSSLSLTPLVVTPLSPPHYRTPATPPAPWQPDRLSRDCVVSYAEAAEWPAKPDLDNVQQQCRPERVGVFEYGSALMAVRFVVG
ncbi:MAG: hypothetical protein M1825_005419 [Sarcosagium campestre]|nr:MAG: hypothetical protein M1825_005419 [Sarcosagium campestre]